MPLAILVGILAIVVGFIVWRNTRSPLANLQELWKDSFTTLQKPTLPILPHQSNPTLPTTNSLKRPSKRQSAVNMKSPSHLVKTPITQTSYNSLPKQGTSSHRRATSGDGMDGILPGVLAGMALSHDASAHARPSDSSSGSSESFTGSGGSYGTAGASASFDSGSSSSYTSSDIGSSSCSTSYSE